MDPQSQTYTGNIHRSSDPSAAASLQTPSGRPIFSSPFQLPFPLVDPPSLESVNAKSFLLNSTRWNCTPSVAAVDGMLTVSSVNILYENCIFSFLPSQITTVKCNDCKFNNRLYMY